MSVTRARVNEIDLLRFLAALMVVFFHYTFRGYAADGLSDVGFLELAPATKYGYLGVELFFMISGFVILMTASSGSLRKFAISRFIRLYPAYWLGCTITFAAILLLGQGRFNATFGQYLLNMTMLNEFIHIPSIDGVYWSLAVEILFYALIAMLLLGRQIHFAQRYLIAWLVITILLELFPVATLRHYLISRYAPFFILGALSYLVYCNGWTKVRMSAFGIAWLLGMNSAIQSAKRYGEHYQTLFDPMIVVTVVSLFASLMIFVSNRSMGAVARRDWSVVGALTYPLYLIHQNLGYMIFNLFGPYIDRYVLLAGTITAMLLIAYAMHTYFERPAASLLKSLLGNR